MNPLRLLDKIISLTPEQADSLIKLSIAITFCMTVLMMIGISLYSVVFVEQPMSGMAPADRQFFAILSDATKYVLGSLATLLAVRGKEGVQKLLEPPGGFTKAEEPPKTAQKRTEPVLEPTPVATGYGGRAAPIQPPHPELS